MENNITEFKTKEGVVKIKELENNRDFKKGDLAFIPVGFGFKLEKVLEDKEGLYVNDACGGNTSKRHIYKSEHEKWDTSLIREIGFRKVELID